LRRADAEQDDEFAVPADRNVLLAELQTQLELAVRLRFSDKERAIVLIIKRRSDDFEWAREIKKKVALCYRY
jgi:hypothetical protein